MTISEKNKIEVFDTPAKLGEATAEYLIKLAYDCVAMRGKFSLSLPGGSTPELLFQLLASPEYKDRMPWASTFIFWGDERYVPMNDNRNNSCVARTLLLDKVNIPAANIFPVPVNLLSATEAAKVYEEQMRTFFGDDIPSFDLIMLGIGANAHTASLFPHTPVIREQKQWVSGVYVDEIKMWRITMTAPLINNARNIMFLAEGKGKAEVLKTVLTSPYQPDEYPAQLISPVHGNLYWFLDKQAAALLS